MTAIGAFVPDKNRKRRHSMVRDLLWTCAVVAVSAALALLVAKRYDDVVAALIFVLGILIAGTIGGLVCAIVAAIAAFLIFNFYLTAPVLTFRLSTGRDLAPLVIFNLCAVITGILAGRLKDRSEVARASNLRLSALLELSRSLQSAVRLEEAAGAVGRSARAILDVGFHLYRVRGEGLEALGADEPCARRLAETLCVGAGSPARDGKLIARRLEGGTGLLGVMVLREMETGTLDPATVEAFSSMVSLALERSELSEKITERRAEARIEELKTALLSSVSHDLRTPLTTISASASSLIAYADKLDAPTSGRLLAGIVDECERLNRYTANLLGMSRLEAGGDAGLQTLSVGDMVAVAVRQTRGRAVTRSVTSLAERDDLLVIANPTLFELVLSNVLDNAILYSDDGTRILIDVAQEDDCCSISICDEGYGIPQADLERVFDRFYRVPRAEASPRGSGLGLAIAKGFVEALDGTIEARIPGLNDRGTRILIRLPLAPGEYRA